MNIETGDQAFMTKLAEIICHKCGTDFTAETILLSVFDKGNYYCEKCGKAIVEGWKAGQVLTSNQTDIGNEM